MSKANEKIKAGIRHLAATQHPVLSGVVQSVDTDANTATVILTMDDDSNPTEGVLLNVILNNASGLLMIPAANANCIVGNVDGSAVKQMLWAEKYDKVLLTIGSSTIEVIDGTITFNGGNNGGFTFAKELKTQLDKTNDLLNAIINVINAVPPILEPGNNASSALQAALKTAILSQQLGDYSNIENTAIKQ